MKRAISILFLLCLLFPLVSSLEIQAKDSFGQGETFYAKLSGVILNDISVKDISLYRGHVRAPADFLLYEFEDEFYISTQLIGKESGDYSIEIKNVEYQKGLDVVKEDLIKNFTITNKTADFYVQPLLIRTQDDFELKIQNLNENTISVDISSGIENSTNSFSLKTGEIKEIGFGISNVEQDSIQNIKLSTANTEYTAKIYVYSKDENEQREMKFQPSELKIPLLTNQTDYTKRIVTLKNTGNIDLEDITFKISNELKDYLILESPTIPMLSDNKSIDINLYFNTNSTIREEFVSGQLTAKQTIDTETIYAYIAIDLNITKDYQPLENETISKEEVSDFIKSCSDYGGVVCGKEQECSVDEIPSTDGNCCLGSCKKPEKSNSNGKIIGWTLVVIAIGIIIWFYFKKYKKTAPKVNLIKKK